MNLGANLGLAVTMAAWGAQIPLIGWMADRYDPYLMTLVRYSGAVPVFLIVLKLTEPGPLFGRLPLRWLIPLGGAMAAFGATYTVGVAFSHPVTAAVLGAMGPAVAALVSWAVLGIRPSRLVAAAIGLVAVGGVLAMVDFSYAETFRLRGGEPLIVLAGVCWSWYSIEAQRRLAGASQTRITGLTLVFASVFLLPIYLVARSLGATHGSLFEAGPLDLGAFAVFTFGAIVIGVYLWNFGVSHLGVVVASMYLNLIPIVAVLIAMGFGYRPRMEQLLGGVLVLGGVVLAQYGPRFRRAPSQGETVS